MQVGAGLQASVADADAGVRGRGVGFLADGGRGGRHGAAGRALEGHRRAQGGHRHMAQGQLMCKTRGESLLETCGGVVDQSFE